MSDIDIQDIIAIINQSIDPLKDSMESIAVDVREIKKNCRYCNGNTPEYTAGVRKSVQNPAARAFNIFIAWALGNRFLRYPLAMLIIAILIFIFSPILQQLGIPVPNLVKYIRPF